MSKTRTTLSIMTENYKYLKEQSATPNGMSAVVDGLIKEHRENGPILDRIQEQVTKLDRLAIELSPFTLQQIMKTGAVK